MSQQKMAEYYQQKKQCVGTVRSDVDFNFTFYALLSAYSNCRQVISTLHYARVLVLCCRLPSSSPCIALPGNL